ncbi:tetratricopeptide repeat protein [Myxococcota bacterium]|nr:tetratricopeptide repeat protein [Myxococcota bacterium]
MRTPRRFFSSSTPSLPPTSPSPHPLSLFLRCFFVLAVLLLFFPSPSSHSQDHQGWLARTYRLFQQGKLPEALQLLQQAEQAVGPHPAFFYYKGLIFQALRQPDQALDAYRQAEPAIDPKFQPWLLNNLGNLFFQKGRYRTAARYYARALQKDPNYPRARFNLELALRAIQQPPPPPPPPNSRQQPPPPQRRDSKRPPPPRPRKKDQVIAPPKQRKWALPPANAFQLKAFDRFLPYSRVLKHHKLRTQQNP